MRPTVSFNVAPERFFRESRVIKQIPFAASLALNEIAADVKTRVERDLHQNLDRPTPFTQKAYAIRRATKTTLVARVFAKDIQAGYLAQQEEGGVRFPKRRAIVVPAGQRVNKYGNMPRGAIQRLLARRDTFSGEINGTAGIWRRLKSGRVRLLVVYASKARYERRLGFMDSARAVARQTHEQRFRAALRRALDTAR